MVKINLRKYYPDFYNTDCIIEVPDEVAALMDSYEHAEAAYYNGSNVKTKIWWEFNEPDISKQLCYATHVFNAE